MQRTLFVALFGLCAFAAAAPLGLTDDQAKALSALQSLDKGFIEQVKACVGDLALSFNQKIAKITELVKALPDAQRPIAEELQKFAVASEGAIVTKLKDFVTPLLETDEAKAVIDKIVAVMSNHDLTGQKIKEETARIYNEQKPEVKAQLEKVQEKIFGKIKGIAEKIAAEKKE